MSDISAQIKQLERRIAKVERDAENEIAALNASITQLENEQNAKWEVEYGVKLGSIHPMNDALAKILRSRSKSEWDADFFIGKYSPFKVHSFEPKGKKMLVRITSESGGWTIGAIPIEVVLVPEGIAL